MRRQPFPSDLPQTFSKGDCSVCGVTGTVWARDDLDIRDAIASWITWFCGGLRSQVSASERSGVTRCGDVSVDRVAAVRGGLVGLTSERERVSVPVVPLAWNRCVTLGHPSETVGSGAVRGHHSDVATQRQGGSRVFITRSWVLPEVHPGALPFGLLGSWRPSATTEWPL